MPKYVGATFIVERISLHPVQLRDEVIYSAWCCSYDTDHFL